MAQDVIKNQQEVAPDSVRKGRLVIRYDKSFSARLIQGESDLRNYYDELKSELLSYKGVKSRISWKYESFRLGKVLIALFKIRGKHLSVYLPLNANDYVDTKYKVDDVSNVKANAETPCAYAIKNNRRCQYAKDLFATILNANDAEKKETKLKKYSDEMPYDTTDNLIQRELIKLVYSRINEKGKEVALKQVTEEEIQALMEEEPEKVVEEPVEEEEVVDDTDEEEEEVVEQPAPVVEEVKPVKKVAPAPVVVEVGSRVMDKTLKGIINVDTLSKNFSAGDTVTLDVIKERVANFNKKVTYVKVLARGILDKQLVIEADEFSAEALNKIALAGGTVVRTKKQ